MIPRPCLWNAGTQKQDQNFSQEDFRKEQPAGQEMIKYSRKWIYIANAPQDQSRYLDLIIEVGADPDSPEGRKALKKLQEMQNVMTGGR